MLDVAERLIALHGVDALSLREVAVEAGQRNHSAVQYHFGDKEGLVNAILADRIAAVNARRRVLLAEADAHGPCTDPAALMGVFFRPLAETVLVRPPGWYGRFLGQIYRTSPQYVSDTRPVMGSLRDLGMRVFEAMTIPVELRAERMRRAVRAGIHLLADFEGELSSPESVSRPIPPEVMTVELVDIVTAVVMAPMSPEMRAVMVALGEGTIDESIPQT